MELYLSPKIKSVNIEVRAAYLQLVSKNTGNDNTGGEAYDFNFEDE